MVEAKGSSATVWFRPHALSALASTVALAMGLFFFGLGIAHDAPWVIACGSVYVAIGAFHLVLHGVKLALSEDEE